MKFYRQHCFSLIEMMVVCVIAAILMGGAALAFRGVGMKSRVDTAGQIVAGTLRIARLQAVVQRKNIAVIMPGPMASGMDDEYRYACIRAAEVTNDGGGVFHFVRWLEDSRWQFLPKGVSIMEADNDPGIYNNATNKFTREPHHNQGPFNFSRVHGVDLSRFGGSANARNIRCIVFGPSGKITGDTDWVTIGAAIFRNGQWIIREPANHPKNQSASNQINLEVRRYTGRTIFVDIDDL